MMGDLIPLLLAGGVCIAAILVALTMNDARQRQPSAIAEQSVLYDGSSPDAAGLVAHASALAGRPAQVIREGEQTLVVLLRSGVAPLVASPPDVVIAAAESVAAEEALGFSITAVLLRYQDRDLRIAISEQMRTLVYRRISEIRALERQGPTMQRQDPLTCRSCAWRSMCPIGKANAAAPL